MEGFDDALVKSIIQHACTDESSILSIALVCVDLSLFANMSSFVFIILYMFQERFSFLVINL